MPDADPRVAVVMITHNRCEEVLRSLGHLTCLPEQPPILLVDNGSTDGTAALVARRFPQIDVLDAGGNLGAAGRTLGVRHVKAPYVALCDDDTWWEPGGLKRAADLFDTHARIGVLTARVLIGPEEREDPVCAELEHSPLPAAPGMPGPPLLGFLAGASVVRRSAFLEVGGFPDHAFLGGEEELLAVDLAAAGWWLCYAPELVVHHYPSPRRDVRARQAHLVRNALWFAWRRPLAGALRRTLRAARPLLWDPAARRGFAAAVAGLPWVLRQRRVVPPEVEHGLRLLESRRRLPGERRGTSPPVAALAG
jgi:GT2 family glycosyltransferase